MRQWANLSILVYFNSDIEAAGLFRILRHVHVVFLLHSWDARLTSQFLRKGERKPREKPSLSRVVEKVEYVAFI